jgi:hypothetical protein
VRARNRQAHKRTDMGDKRWIQALGEESQTESKLLRHCEYQNLKPPDWTKIGEKMGMMAVLKVFGLHFAYQKTRHANVWGSPVPDTFYIQCDFKEHDSVPFGPHERGRLAVRGVKVLGGSLCMAANASTVGLTRTSDARCVLVCK